MRSAAAAAALALQDLTAGTGGHWARVEGHYARVEGHCRPSETPLGHRDTSAPGTPGHLGTGHRTAIPRMPIHSDGVTLLTAKCPEVERYGDLHRLV